MLSFVPAGLSATLAKLPPIKRIGATIIIVQLRHAAGSLRALQLEHPLRVAHDAQGAQRQRHRMPKLETYAHRLWYYWETQLDPDLFIDNSLEGNVRGKLVIITGGGTGIGLATRIGWPAPAHAS